MSGLRFRAKASRASYRRAGLVLGSADWSSEFALDDIGASRMAILAGDPIVILQGRRKGGDWETIPAAARAEFASAGLQVIDPDPTTEGGPSWADVEAARLETAELSREVVQALQDRVAELEGLLGRADNLIKGGEEERRRIEAKAKEAAEALQKQVDGLKAALVAAKAKAKPTKADKTGPADPPASEQA